MKLTAIDKEQVKSDLLLETAKIPWVELQRFFAAGKVLIIDQNEDLLEVAASLIDNDVQRLQAMIDADKIAHPSDQQAKSWYEQKSSLWAVVLKPWVIVQENSA